MVMEGGGGESVITGGTTRLEGGWYDWTKTGG